MPARQPSQVSVVLLERSLLERTAFAQREVSLDELRFEVPYELLRRNHARRNRVVATVDALRDYRGTKGEIAFRYLLMRSALLR